MDFNVFMKEKIKDLKGLNLKELKILFNTAESVFKDLSKANIFDMFLGEISIQIESIYKKTISQFFSNLANLYKELTEKIISIEKSGKTLKDSTSVLIDSIEKIELNIISLEAILNYILSENDKNKFNENLVNLIYSQFEFRKELNKTFKDKDKESEETEEETEETEEETDLDKDKTLYINKEIALTKLGKNTYKISKMNEAVIILI